MSVSVSERQPASVNKQELALATAIRQLILNWNEERITKNLIDSELEIRTAEEKHIRRYVIYEMKKEGVLESIPGLVGVYRLVDGVVSRIDYLNADPNKILKLRFPLGLERYFLVCPKNIGIVAGVKDSGKTGFLLNVAYLNQDTYPVYYFSSEMGEIELRRRLDHFEKQGIIPVTDWKVEFIERSDNFADVIRPEAVNLIDFLEVYDEFYKVGAYINQIYRRLTDGVAIIAIQKNEGAEWGIGRERGLEKARFYLTLGGGKLKIKSAKNWAKEDVNPVGKEICYKLIQGCRFIEKRNNATEGEPIVVKNTVVRELF